MVMEAHTSASSAATHPDRRAMVVLSLPSIDLTCVGVGLGWGWGWDQCDGWVVIRQTDERLGLVACVCSGGGGGQSRCQAPKDTRAAARVLDRSTIDRLLPVGRPSPAPRPQQAARRRRRRRARGRATRPSRPSGRATLPAPACMGQNAPSKSKPTNVRSMCVPGQNQALDNNNKRGGGARVDRGAAKL